MAKTSTSTTHQPSEAQVQGFVNGRDLAVLMLEDKRRHEDGAFIEAEMRDGQLPTFWVREYIERATVDPFVLEGFCAVLANELCVSGYDLDIVRSLRVEQMRPEWRPSAA